MNPFSGNERNRLFIQSNENFEEASTVSGADFKEDGRGFAVLDFDHDGFLDMGVTSMQRPRFRLLRNTIGDIAKNEGSENQSVFIRLVGGNKGVEQQTQWSPRTPFGAQILVTTGDTKRVYQLACGEGLSCQNSSWIHVGMGQSMKIDRIKITWPSGKVTLEENVKAGARITVFENSKDETSRKVIRPDGDL